MIKKLGIIGHFGGDKNFLDGQTVKTKVLYEELSKRGFDDIFCVDTYYNKTNKIRLIWDTLRCFFKCDAVVALLSTNGLRVYLPMLYMAKKIFKIRVFHDVIGGHLHTDIKEMGGRAVEYLNSLDANWVETRVMKKELENSGITNCDIFTNFKTLNSRNAIYEPDEKGRYRFCMFSRVMEDKGVTDAIEAVVRFNESHDTKVHLDIWGTVDAGYEDKFNELLKLHSESITYGGCVDFGESVSTLTNHIALLFPTKFMGEGCPGTVIDAYASALPVISSSWDAADEMIKDFQTGWIYPNDKISSLDESIEWAVEHYDEMVAMRKNCTLLATRYTADFVVRRIIDVYLKN